MGNKQSSRRRGTVGSGSSRRSNPPRRRFSAPGGPSPPPAVSSNARTTSSSGAAKPPRAPAVPSASSDPRKMTMYCQCPQCHRHLQTPPGHRRFQCPCGKKIEIVPPAPPKFVKCPKCHQLLNPPKHTQIFCCPCGETLSMPTVAGQWNCRLCKHQNFLRVNCEMCGATPSGQLKDATSAEDPNAAEADYGKQRAEAVQASKATWRRTRFQGLVTDPTTKKVITNNTFRWQYNAHYDCTKQYTIDRDFVESLPVAELKRRLARMSVDCTTCVEKSELCDLLCNSEEQLNVKPVKQLQLLLVQNCITTRCVEKRDLVNCLIQHLVLEDARPDSAMGWVRQLDASMQLKLVAAEECSMSLQQCKIPLEQLCAVATMPFKGKINWFRKQIDHMRIPPSAGQIKVRVRRSHLLQDAYDSFSQIMGVNYRRHFKFEFIGEPAIDAGGVAREWFTCVINSLFNVDFGLFKYGQDQLCFQINEFSGIANELHLGYFKFAGRLLGKALFDCQICPAHLALPLYKHLLSYPIAMSDLNFVDAELARSLKQVFDEEDAEDLCLDFTIAHEAFGVTTSIDLKPGGEDIEVTNKNRKEYTQLMFKHYMSRCNEQFAHFLSGFYEIVPEYLLTVFDFMELELVCCGLPNLDVNDWRENTAYKGVFHPQHRVVQWFWEVVMNYSQEKRARLLQFATSTSRVPVAGFKQLQSNLGKPCSFQLLSIPLKDGPFPKAHTCFNRVDLPLYKSKADLEKFVTIAITCESSGFGIE